MNVDFTLNLSVMLLSLSLLLQSFEMLNISSKVGAHSPWSWNHVRNDFAHWPSFFLFSFDHLYEENFKFLVLTQIILTLCLLWEPHIVIFFLIMTYFLIALRFRGNFNGGSDAMTMVTLVSLTFAFQKTSIGFYLLAFHCTLSYFMAGMVKLRNKSWRSGLALQTFLTHSNYAIPSKIQKWTNQKSWMILGSWIVILFECSFPLVWLFPKLTTYYVVAASLFHVINYFCLGLNRFVFTWIASYPALLFCTQNYNLL